MSIFDFNSEGVDQVLQSVMAQRNQLDDIAQYLTAVTNPIEEGAWIGEGANAFLADANQSITECRAISAQVMVFYSLLSTSSQEALDAIQQIQNTINRPT
jgi:uncharacterized protein YukE